MVYLSIHMISCFSDFFKVSNGYIKKEILYGLVLAIIIEIVIVRLLKYKIQ